jgi:glutathione S-transferase
MILIGQYDSSFVRRCAIALRLYGVEFEHEPWSTFGDADKIRDYNPLTRVPTLVLENGTVLNDSCSIIDYADSIAPQDKLLMPYSGPERYAVMSVMSLATGLADKVVALFYERRLHDHPSQTWMDRCEKQIETTLGVLEAGRVARTTPFWFGETITHADIAVACTWRHLGDSHPGILSGANIPGLRAHCAMLEAMPVFQEISQVFIPPA